MIQKMTVSMYKAYDIHGNYLQSGKMYLFSNTKRTGVCVFEDGAIAASFTLFAPAFFESQVFIEHMNPETEFILLNEKTFSELKRSLE